MKNNWKEEFRKEFIGEGYTHPGMESFIESLLEEQKKELMEEVRLNCFLVDDVDNQRRDVPCIEYVKLKDIIENHD